MDVCNSMGPQGGDTPPEPDWLTFKDSPIHGQGAFARCFIPKGIRVIEYLGEIIDKTESLRQCEANNEYIFSLSEQQDINGKVPWNPARLINHSCRPNCEALLEEGHIWIMSTRDIQAGEEITFNYGFDLQDYEDYPCRCGARDCVGYIVAEEFFDYVRQRQASPGA